MAKYPHFHATAEPGEHTVTVMAAELKRSKSGSEMVVLQLRVDGISRWIRENLVLSPKTYWKFEQFLDAIGKKPAPDEDIEPMDFVGCTARAVIGVHDFNDREQNHIEKWLKSERVGSESPSQSGSTQAGNTLE
jgi:Protein of unknown function (DUF669)